MNLNRLLDLKKLTKFKEVLVKKRHFNGCGFLFEITVTLDTKNHYRLDREEYYSIRDKDYQNINEVICDLDMINQRNGVFTVIRYAGA